MNNEGITKRFIRERTYLNYVSSIMLMWLFSRYGHCHRVESN